MAKKLLLLLAWSAGGVVALAAALFVLAWATEWRPAEVEVLHEGRGIAPLPDTLTIVTWNTGYGGLGNDMDFFMDGGTRTRTSRERTTANLDRIARFLAACDADIVLLQEVDRGSRRSYRTDQFALYRDALPAYHGYWAPNYHSPFVPVPLCAPLGRVEAGVAIFSRVEPEQVVRHRYHSKFPFPRRLFDMKHCWLAALFHTARGGEVWISATHNTAYDSGGMRAAETEQIYAWMGGRGCAIVGGDWNQNPPGYTPSAAAAADPHFSPRSISHDPRFDYAFDPSTPTARWLDEPLTPGTTRSVIDFFVTRGVRPLDVRTVDLGFESADHNPVVARFAVSD